MTDLPELGDIYREQLRVRNSPEYREEARKLLSKGQPPTSAELTAMIVKHMDDRNNSRRPPDDIDRALWSDALDGGTSFADLLGLFAEDD